MKRQNQNWFGPSPNRQYFNLSQQVEEEPSLRIVQTPQFANTFRSSPIFPGNLDGIFSSDQYSYPQERHMESINERISFSDSESEGERINDMEMDIETPPQEYREKEEVNSTGCKSFNGKVHQGKKSRPKDKGLRGLSSKAFRLVLQLKVTTYKDVASRLIRQLTLSNELEGPTEETNIKRRVYDALNVLIAVGILEKSGKSILVKSRIHNQYVDNLEKEMKTSFQSFILAEDRVRQKKQQLEKAKRKMVKIRQLMEKNVHNRQVDIESGKIVRFPFVAFGTRFNIKQVQYFNTKAEVNPENIQIQFRELIDVMGDVDLLHHI